MCLNFWFAFIGRNAEKSWDGCPYCGRKFPPISSLATNAGTDGEFKIDVIGELKTDGTDEFPQMLTWANPLRGTLKFGLKFLDSLKNDEMEVDADDTFCDFISTENIKIK